MYLDLTCHRKLVFIEKRTIFKLLECLPVTVIGGSGSCRLQIPAQILHKRGKSLIRDGFFCRGEDQSLIHTRKLIFVFQEVCVGGVVAVIISKSQQRKLIISAIAIYAE